MFSEISGSRTRSDHIPVRLLQPGHLIKDAPVFCRAECTVHTKVKLVEFKCRCTAVHLLTKKKKIKSMQITCTFMLKVNQIGDVIVSPVCQA